MMRNHNINTSEFEQRLGQQIRQTRLGMDTTQAELARRANVDRTTIGRIESGEGGNITSLIRIARALDREDWLDSFAPPTPAISPMQLLREQQHRETKRRKRARPTPTAP